MTSSKKYEVTVDEAMQRLAVIPEYDAGDGPKPCVHTFRDTPVGLLGAHWALDDLRALMERHGVEESGSAAQSFNHGLVVVEPHGPLFLDTGEGEHA